MSKGAGINHASFVIWSVMRPYIGPIILSAISMLAIALSVHGVSEKVLRGRSDHDIESMRKAFSGRFAVIGPVVFAAYGAYGVLASIWAGSQIWWAWLIALIFQLTYAYVAAKTRHRFFERTRKERWTPSEGDVIRGRFTRLYLAAALVAFVAGRLLIPNDGGEPTWRAVGGLVLLVLSLLSLCAAGWSSVWVFKTRERSTHIE